MTKSIPKVTVILPFYNAETTLERAVESIAAQSLEDFECILINNNSTDGSVKIAMSRLETDKRFRLLHESRQGVAFASNLGSRKAKGKYIARMDADDLSYPDRLALQAAFLDAHRGYGAVAGLVRHVGDKSFTKGFARYVDWVNSISSYKEILNKQFVELPVVNPSAMWRREVAKKYGMYNAGDFPEDYEMWLRWLAAGVKVAKIEQTVLYWYDLPGRLSRTGPEYSDAAFYRIKSKYLAHWLKRNNPFHPEVAVWGASRISRRRARLLKTHGIEISCYIDTRRGRLLDQPLTYYEDLPEASKMFILTYIKQMDARSEIQDYLHGKGYREGVDYLLVS